ncbi:MAG: CDP-alcohol phosphatidyltransferase family protein [Prevotella sp.]|nr:CDP-alcohol phosphatidyltransferase family protein [Prevotella sp.]
MSESRSFKELLRVSFKSEDTEEWLDVHFTRPIGLVFALFWMRWNVHPNVITILSIILGAVGGCLFFFPDLWHNVAGVILLIFANFCDSTDGQMARLTGKKTLVGRVLDGFSENVWFFFIYLAIIKRTGDLFYDMVGGWAYVVVFVVCYVAGAICHSRQCSLADYYRQIHLYFLLGKNGSELDTYEEQRKVYASLPENDRFARLFYYCYANYCKSQEQRTPAFQQFYHLLRERYPQGEELPVDLRDTFRKGSLPLMKYTNLLTFNARAIVLYLSCLLDVPYVYPLAELTVFAVMYYYMHQKHETLCRKMIKRLL